MESPSTHFSTQSAFPINQLKTLTSTVRSVAKEAGGFIRSEFGKVSHSDIQEKDMNSLVSYVDINAEKLIVEKLKAALPGAGFITEEGTSSLTNDHLYWIIDPLDGTTNFLKGLPVFSVSIALANADEILMGVVYDITQDWCFHAIKGQGAFMDDEKITVSSEDDFSKCIIATGFPYEPIGQDSVIFKILQNIIQDTRGIRRLGSAAIDLAYVACGKFDGFYETTLNAWDMAAGVVLVEEAGGIVSDFWGEREMLFNGSIIAATKNTHNRIHQIITNSGFRLPD